MSYQVLARKWRPKSFSSLVGQEHVVRALTHALTQQRLHHAYLFTGTRGVGKTTIARILAKSLNCQTGITATPCGACSPCLEIDKGSFVDLLEVDAATNTRVDEMRQLLENAIYAPTSGRYKVYVIDEVHMLSTSAFNAMLKTLEEPPEHIKFILATTDPQKIPVTVLSRCLQFNLKQMPASAISAHLAQVLDAESVPYDQNALALIARSANGSMRDALSLLDQAIAHGAGEVSGSQVRNMLGTVDQDYLFSMLESLLAGDVSGLLQAAADLSVRSLSFSSALQELGVLLTRLQIAQCAPSTRDEDDPDQERLNALADGLSPEFVQLAYQIALAGRSELASAPDEYSGFVMTLLRMHTFRPRSAGELVARVSYSGNPKAASPTRTPEVHEGMEASGGARGAVLPDLAAVSEWHQIVSAMQISGLAKELAQHCELRSLGEGECLLRLAPAQSHLQMKPSPERLQQALGEFFGRAIQLRIELAEVEVETPAKAASRDRQERQGKAVAAIEQDTFVRDVIDIFDASLVQSSIKPI